jgi:hypothetical protein
MEFYTIEINGILSKSFSTEKDTFDFLVKLNKLDKIIIWLEEYPDDYHGGSDAHGYKTKIYEQN